jgi:hypothetical protein
MTRPLAIAAVLLAIAGALASGIVLHRIDLARAHARAATRATDRHRAELTALRQADLVLAAEIERHRTTLATCRQRTENLRAVLETLIGESVWTARVRLPDPPPGWPAWPRVGEYSEPGGTR